jgi:diaminopimelate epimerase
MIPFTKAHACGNDFLIIPEESVQNLDHSELTQRLCDRNYGIGADGVEYFDWTGDTSGHIELYNADGSQAEISGNGTRCVAAWMANELNSQVGDELSIETGAGVRICKIDGFRDSDTGGPTTLVTTNMQIPEFEQTALELADGTRLNGVFVSMGNPHFVVFADREGAPDFYVGGRDWDAVGEEICHHADFPDQTNVEIVRVTSSPTGPLNQVEIRIYERGVGPTASSGTGTCAVAAAMIAVFHATAHMEVIAPGGAQTVDWAGAGQPLYLTGPATLTATGEAW